MSTDFSGPLPDTQVVTGAGAARSFTAPDAPAAEDSEDSPALLPETRAFINLVKSRLRAGASFNNPGITALANETFGGSRMRGTFSPKYVYDCVETAVNELLLEEEARELMGMAAPALGLAHVLRPLVRQLPTQTDRTQEQQLLQQFSTPPTLAFIAARVLNPRPGDLVMDSSAGTGSLIVWAKAAGAQVLTNEISPRRTALLELMGLPTTSFDAEFLDDLYPAEVVPTAFLINPPFSATGGRVARNSSEYGARHIESSLRRMAMGGRLTAVMGEGIRLDKPAFRQWWRRIASLYTVRAVVGVDGREYAKYGTTFSNCILVIDKTGPTPGATWEAQLETIRWGNAETLEQVWAMLADVAKDRPRPGEVRTKPQEPTIITPHTSTDAGEVEASAVASTLVEEHVAQPSTQAQAAPAVVEPIEAGASEEAVASRPGEESTAGEEDEDIFVPYKPAMLAGGVEHPALIVESRSMGSVYPPPITYRPHLPRRVLKRGLLSALQMERVCYAGQAHEQRLPDGARGGFFVGDGTGVGKGRILAGIIVDNWFQGYDRAVWLSVNNDLMDSARRDLNDLGVRVPLHKINDFDVRKPITATCGVVFSSYNSLIASAKSGETRLAQLQEWLGPNGLLVLDECVPAGTMIATPAGEVPIEELKEGDLVLGYDQETGLIKRTRVNHLFRRETGEPLFRICETNLTGNHPVWTAGSGYVRADRVGAADRVGTLERMTGIEGEILRLRVVPPVLHTQVPPEQEAEGGEAPVLQPLLLRKVEDVAAGVREKADDGEEPTGGAREPETNQGAPRRAAQAGRLPAFALEPDLLAGNVAQGEKGVQEARLRPPHGRERHGADRTAGAPAVEARLEGGALRRREAAEAGPALALQARFGGPGVEACHRDRRPVPPDPRGEAPGREEDGVPGVTGVARAPVQERGGALRHRRGDREGEGVRRVYNIETGTGNYFANSLLVHNCHKAKNALAGGRGEPTQTGQAVIDLQSAERNPDYRVVYSSATGATDVRHMSYMVRLGLWGEGTPFPGGFGEFMCEIDSGGVGAMEMVCRDLKALGKYASASISFGLDPLSGLSVEYREVIHRLTPEQRRMYDAMAEAWQIILQNIDQALELTNGDNRARANAMQKFWGDHQRCCRSVISAFKVPTLIAEVERELAAGHACVISLIGTGESKTKEQIARQTAGGGQIEDLDFSPREMICGMVDRGFPTTQYVEKTDPSTGQTIKVPLLDGEGKAVESKEALRMKQMLLDQLSGLDLPEHPLDQIVNYFGPRHVAELTGRKRRLIRQPDGRLEYVKRNPEGVAMANANLHEMALFQEGKKDIAIISDAASTGISLHADRRAGNQKRRVHLTLELNWSADKQLQTFGRTHRSNQAQPPIYVLLSTELGGEKRFSSTIAKRLASLGALTKGDRGAADGGDLTKYNFETDEGSAALNLLYGNILRGVVVDGLDSARQTLRKMGLLVRRVDGGEEVKKENLHNVPRFLNRVLALGVDEQNAMFNYFVELFEQTIRYAKANGTFDEGVQDIKATAIRLGATPRVVHQDALTGAKTTHYKLEVDQPTHPVSFEDAKDTPRGTFYRQKRSGHYVLAVESGNHTDPASGASYRSFALTKPEAARAYYIKESELVEKYQPVRAQEVRWWWQSRYEQVPEVVTVEAHIIGGAILPLWQHLKTEEGSSLRVVRVTTDDGLRIVGIQIPKNKLSRVLRALGISRSFKETAQIYSGVLEEGEEINLVGGLKLRKSFVHGEEAIELVGADPYKYEELRDLGLINESIAYRQRFFIPTDEQKGLPVLEAVLKRYPAISTEEEMKETTAEDLERLLEERVCDINQSELIVNLEELLIVPEGYEGEDEPEVHAGAQGTDLFAAAVAGQSQTTLTFVSGSFDFEGGVSGDEEVTAPIEEEESETSLDFEPARATEVSPSPQPTLFGVTEAPKTASVKGRKKRRPEDGRQGFLWAA